MSAVFLDTVDLLALWDRSDQWHIAAENAFEQLAAARAALLTTTFVLLECGNAAARRPYSHSVNRLRERLEEGQMLVTPTKTDWNQAWAAYERGEANRAGIVDQVSFLVMRRLGLSHAFTNDQHFAAAGFQPLF